MLGEPLHAHRFIEVAGLRLHVVESSRTSGAGSVALPGVRLVFVHGLFATSRGWLPVMDHLAGDTSCLALDLPGCGQSEKPSPRLFSYAIPGLADVLGEAMTHLVQADEPVVLVGHSLGGAVAAWLAAERPSWLRALVLVNPACFRPPVPLVGQLVNVPHLGPFLFRRAYQKPVYLSYFRKQAFSGNLPEDVRSSLAEDYADFATPEGRDASYAMYQHLLSMPDLRARLSEIVVPTLLVRGTGDGMIPKVHTERALAALRGARYAEIPEAPHAAPQSHASEVSSLLLGFLREVHASRAAKRVDV